VWGYGNRVVLSGYETATLALLARGDKGGKSGGGWQGEERALSG